MKPIIPLVKTNMPPEDILMPELKRVLYSGYIALGEDVYHFEKNFSTYIGNRYALAVSSGTAALHIALILAGVKPGDEVISTVITSEATNTAILNAGGKIVWGDVDYETGCLSPQSVEEKISEKTKAIIAVDYAGVPINIKEFQRISSKYSIPVIQDAAHALGARYDNVKIGNHFPYVIFSFQAIKHMTTGDGGALCLKDSEDYKRGKIIRWFGLDKKEGRLENNIKEMGYKYNMNNINAAFGNVQLMFIDEIISKNISNGKYYDAALAGINGLELLDYYPGSAPSYWLYTLKVERRNDFIRYLEENGIEASELHLRNDRHDIFGDSSAQLPNADRFYEKMVHIPCGWWVTGEDRERIFNLIIRGW